MDERITYPTFITAVPTLVLWLYCSLLFVPPDKVDAATLARTRMLLLPVIITIIWTCYSHPEQSFFKPAREFLYANMVIQVGKYWGIYRAIEYAFADPEDYIWMGYGWAYGENNNANNLIRENGNPSVVETHGTARPDGNRQIVGQRYGQSVSEILWLGWRCGWTQRGIGWTWGIKRQHIPNHFTEAYLIPKLIWRLIRSHIAAITCLAYIAYSRQLSLDPSYILRYYLNLSDSTGPILAGRLVQVLAFGISIWLSMDTDLAYLMLFIYIFTGILRTIIPKKSSVARYLRPDPFRAKAWPDLFKNPLKADSLADFWGNRWHALFRAVFLAVCYRPGIVLSKKLGFQGRTIPVAVGALTAFALSGVLHESYNEATFYRPRDPYYRSFAFFLLQGVGIACETLFSSIAMRRVSGTLGRIWTWSYLLLSGMLLAECWIERGLLDGQPPVEQWEWWRWTIPNAVIVPSSSRAAMYRLYDHLK